ncbi:transposase [Candidatus Sumerlaeota bacterium]|nr:transposase [Candidatus Sumerlaeota bacterium]
MKNKPLRARSPQRDGLERFRRVLKTFTRGLWGILNFLRTGLTNGLSGGLNNAIGTLKKMAYGYRDFNLPQKIVMNL